MKHNSIRRIITGILSISLLLVGLTACSKTTETTTDTAKTSEAVVDDKAATTEATEAVTTEAAQPKELISINLGYPTSGIDFIGGVAGIAQELGYLDEELEKAGYKLNYQGFTGAGPAVNEALAGGKIDLAIYADFPGIVIKSKGVDIQLLSIVTQVGHAGIVVAKDSPIQTITDLKGKKIAFPKGTYVQKYLLQALEAYGLKENEVELINMTTDAESALLSGAVDAVAYTDGFIANIAYGEAGGKIINTSRENEDWTGAYVLVARTAFIDENKEAGVAFLTALLRAKEYAKQNSEAVYQLFADKQKISLETSKYLYNLDDSKFDYYTLDVTEKGQNKLTANKQFLLDSGLIQDDFDVIAWGDNSYYEEALKAFNQ